MTQSDQINELAKALIEFHRVVPPIKKETPGQIGTWKGYKYATLDTVLEIVTPLLCQCGLALSQTLDDGCVCTTLVHHSGQFISSKTPIPINVQGQKETLSNAQILGVGITYLRRYAVSAILNLATEEDNDGVARQPRPQQAAPIKQYPSLRYQENQPQPRPAAPPNTVQPPAPQPVNPTPAPVAPVAPQPASVPGASAPQVPQAVPGQDPWDTVLHFSKNVGRTLRSLSEKQLLWYQENVTGKERDGYPPSEDDIKLRHALDQIFGASEPVPTPEVPAPEQPLQQPLTEVISGTEYPVEIPF